MTHRRIKTMLWITAGLLMSLAVLLVVLNGLSGQMWITDSQGIPVAADAVMNCIQTGNWDHLQTLVADNPELFPSTGEEGSVDHMIWTAYQQSLQWHCADEFQIRGSHIEQNLTVSCLDISALIREMTEIHPELPSDLSEEQALLAAAEQILKSDMPIMSKTITLTFTREAGQWKMIPNNSLLALLSGFTGS